MRITAEFVLLIAAIFNFKNGLAWQNSIMKLSSKSFSTGNVGRIVSLKGGYDATIGPDPTNPIQFFTLTGGMCPYAARTLIVLNELQLPFETVEVSGKPKPDWYLRINPRGKVPALRVPFHNNEIIYESAICDEYLCDLYDSQIRSDASTTSEKILKNTLMPNDPVQRARIRLLNDQCDTVLNPAFFTLLMNKDTSKDEDLRNKLNDILMTYEETLTKSGGPYLTGKDFTLADVHLLPFFLRLSVSLPHFKNFQVSIDNYPKLVSWYDICSERDSVKAAAKTDETIISVYQKFVDMDYEFGGLNKNT